jgi:hypothetical protein
MKAKSNNPSDTSPSITALVPRILTAIGTAELDSLSPVAASGKVEITCSKEAVSGGAATRADTNIAGNAKFVSLRTRAFTCLHKVVAIFGWLSLKFRPGVKDGYQRITWKCVSYSSVSFSLCRSTIFSNFYNG